MILQIIRINYRFATRDIDHFIGQYLYFLILDFWSNKIPGKIVVGERGMIFLV